MRAHLAALALVLAAMTIFPGEGPRAALAAAHAPAFDHIFVIMEENMDSSQIVGNPAAPFINSVLLQNNFWYTNYFGLAHGSLPDYLGLVSGSEHRAVIGDPPGDCSPTWGDSRPACAVTAPWPSNLADSIESSGRSWRAYLQSMGRPCRWQAPDARYDVTHNPFVYFATVQGGTAADSQRCRQRDVDLTRDSAHPLAADLGSATATPNFLFIVPDNAHNMHDGNVAGADRFLQDLFTGSNASGDNGVNPIDIFHSPAWTHDRSIAYVVWDEDSGTFRNQVVAIAIGNWVNGPEGRDGTAFDHYSLLRTWESAWGLRPIGQGDAAAAPMLSAFNLLRTSDGAPGRSPMRVALSASHPEVYASLDIEAGSGGASRLLMTMQAADGAVLARLRLDADRRLMLACLGAGGAPTSVVPLDGRGHHLEMHYAVIGEAGRCDLVEDGRPVSELSQAWAGAADATAVRAVQIGDPGAAQPGPDLIRNVEIATSPN